MQDQPEERDPIKDAFTFTNLAFSDKLQTGTRMQIVLGAVAGACLALLSALGGMRPLDDALNFALYALTIGLGCLAVAFYFSTMCYEESADPWVQGLIVSKVVVFRLGETVGLLAAGAGIVAYLGNFQWWAGAILAAIIIGLPLLRIVGSLGYVVAWSIRHRHDDKGSVKQADA
ncbi:MAG: hypothetical protein ACREMY_24855 [bacterium]